MSTKRKKHKLIKKGNGNEPTVIEFNLSKAVIILTLIGIILFAIATKEIVTTIIETKQKELLANEETTDSGIEPYSIENGDKGYITSAQLTEVKTGVGPFDADDEPGNDSSEDNNIIRSFDQITWTLEVTMGLKDETTTTKLTGGIIEVEVSLPEHLANLVEWDLDSMLWLEDANISDDGRNLSGKYTMGEDLITIPGKTNLIFILQVRNVLQGTIIQPTFTTKLTGNSEGEEVITIGDEIIVSSTGKYNIQLSSNTNNLANKTTVNIDGTDITGRMYGYGLTVQVYNDNESKGIKGLELPKGDITFDIILKLERTKFGSEELEDITSEATPILWNYRENNKDQNNLTGKIDGRQMYFNDDSDTIYNYKLPQGINNGNRKYTTYNSGDLQFVFDGNTLHATLSGYDFDGDFPRYSNSSDKKYTDNIGPFSAWYLQVFVPNTEASLLEDRNYYLTISDTNMNIMSSTGELITTQMKTSDDDRTTQHVLRRAGTYGHRIEIKAKNGSYTVEPSSGTGRANIGDIIRPHLQFELGMLNDDNIETANKFFKFDGDAFLPVYYDDNTRYRISGERKCRI